MPRHILEEFHVLDMVGCLVVLVRVVVERPNVSIGSVLELNCRSPGAGAVVAEYEAVFPSWVSVAAGPC